MNIKEAYDALLRTLEDIAKKATDTGLTADVRCAVTDFELNELSEDSYSGAVLISGEISIGAEGAEGRIVLECAISIDEDGNVTNDAIAQEVGVMRATVSELCDRLDKTKPIKEAFSELCDSEEGDVELDNPAPVRSNKAYYLTALVALGIAVIAILIKWLVL